MTGPDSARIRQARPKTAPPRAEIGTGRRGTASSVPYPAQHDMLGRVQDQRSPLRGGRGGCGEALRRFCTVATSLARAETLMFLASPLAVRP